MNLKLVLKLVGRIMLVETVAMLLPLFVALLYGESIMPFVWSILLMAVSLSKKHLISRIFAQHIRLFESISGIKK